jgi:hypothetical protein
MSQVQCNAAIAQGKQRCRASHHTARKTCFVAWNNARKQTLALKARADTAADIAAHVVAHDAKLSGVPRLVAKRATRKAAQDAAAAAVLGVPKKTMAQHHAGSMSRIRKAVRLKISKVVAGVRKVWKLKVRSAIAAASKAAVRKARSQGKSASEAKAAAVKAARAAATSLQKLAREAEARAGARAMQPLVDKLDAQERQFDKKQFAKVSESYKQRTKALMRQMQAARAELKTKHARRMKASSQELAFKNGGKDWAHMTKQERDEAKERHGKLVAHAARAVRTTTEQVAGAGAKVSRTLARIAREAKEAANDARNTEVAVSEASESDVSQ